MTKVHRYIRRIYRQKPQYFLFAKHVNKISINSMMKAKLVRTIDKDWNVV